MTTLKAAADASPRAATWRGQKIPIAAMLAIFIVAPFVVYPVVLMKALCFALFACAFNLLIGYVGLLSFGHALFLGSAGYAAAHTAKVWGLPPELAILFGTAFSAAIGAVVGAIAIRRQGIYFAMVTLALAQMAYFSHLRQRQGDHREVDALAANGNRAYHRPDRRGERGTEKDRQFRRQSPHLRGMGRRVSRRAEEQGVAERKQTYVADEQIEGASEQRKTERLHQNDRVDDEGRGDEDREHGGDRNPLSPPTGRQRSGVCCCFHRGHLTALFQKVPRTSPAIPAP